MNPSDAQQDAVTKDLEELIQDAHKLGASAATVISTKDIIVDDIFADRCREPRCEGYGMSKSCPPYVSGPSAFRKQLKRFTHAIFFKIDIPTEILYSSERRECFKALHEIAAGIEKSAVKMGFADAQAYVGGSCKMIFCDEHPECLVVSGKGECRNQQHARPSMSGFGIDVAKVFEAAGWTMSSFDHGTDSEAVNMTPLGGLILIY